MKHLSKITIALILSLTFFACNEDQLAEQQNLVDNSENISKLIKSFDLTLKKSIENTNLNETELGDIFINESKKQGLKIVDMSLNNHLAKTDEEVSFSNEFIEYSNTIAQTNSYGTKEEYKNYLMDLNNEVLNSNIAVLEQQILVDSIGIMIAFVDWMGTLDEANSEERLLLRSECEGWWDCWGKCVAGTLGGGVTGSVAGCGVGAAVGAAVGTVAAPGPGTAAGAVGGCAAGGILGAIGGALSGAADHC